MSTNQIFTIGSPCHEEWDQMSKVEKGRFCDVCAKCVVDLSGKSQEEIKSLYVQHEGNLCGSMPLDQYQASKERALGPAAVPALSPAAVRPAVRSPRLPFLSRMHLFAACFVAAFGIFWHSSVKAQSKHPMKGKVANIPHETAVEGVVMKDGKAVRGVQVTASKGELLHDMQTDKDGKFRFAGLETGVWYLSAYASGDFTAYKQVEVKGRGVERVVMNMEVEMMLGDVMPYEANEPLEEEEIRMWQPRITGDTILVDVVNGNIAPLETKETECELVGEVEMEEPMIAGGIRPYFEGPQVLVEEEIKALLPEEATKLDIDPGSSAESENGLSTLAEGFEIVVMPIPTHNEVNVLVKRSPSDKPMELLLFSTEGKLLKTARMNASEGSRMKLDLSNLPAGVYYLKGMQDDYIFQQKVLRL